KILEAMAAGVPVVATTIGAEGILCQPGADILIADDVPGLVDHLAAVLCRPEYAQGIALAARQLVSARYDWDAIVLNLEQLYYEHLRLKRGRGSTAPGTALARRSAG